MHFQFFHVKCIFVTCLPTIKLWPLLWRSLFYLQLPFFIHLWNRVVLQDQFCRKLFLQKVQYFLGPNLLKLIRRIDFHSFIVLWIAIARLLKTTFGINHKSTLVHFTKANQKHTNSWNDWYMSFWSAYE